uniref:Uncharacterized protein n=1 Tax=Oryza meridionalis TaxID=40149 RepID=A0A0E0FA21_9ORYZ
MAKCSGGTFFSSSSSSGDPDEGSEVRVLGGAGDGGRGKKEEFVGLKGMAMGGGGTGGWQGGDAITEVVELVAGGGPVLVVGAKRSDRIRRQWPVVADPVARSHWRWGRRQG